MGSKLEKLYFKNIYKILLKNNQEQNMYFLCLASMNLNINKIVLNKNMNKI